MEDLVVVTNDFGLPALINQGIINAYKEGIIISSALMISWSATDISNTLHDRISRA